MRLHYSQLLIAACIIAGAFVFAPATAQKLPIKFGIKGDVGIPNPISNKAFKLSFAGVYEVGLAPVVNIHSGFTLGAFGHISQFKVPILKIPNVKTLRNTQSAGVKAGYEFLVSENIIFSFMMDYGFAKVMYKNNECIDSTKVQNINLNLARPSFSFYFVVDPDFAMGGNISYTMMNEKFDPTTLCFENKKQYFPGDLTGKTNYFNFGVSLYYFFVKKGMAFNLKERKAEPEQE
jgi:hypothetical protein